MKEAVQEYKINVHAEPIDGLSMAKYEFECQFYTRSNKVVTIPKIEMKKSEVDGIEDDNNYIAILDSEKIKRLEKGSLKMKFVAHIPDSDFSDGFRTEIVDNICTGVVIT